MFVIALDRRKEKAMSATRTEISKSSQKACPLDPEELIRSFSMSEFPCNKSFEGESRKCFFQCAGNTEQYYPRCKEWGIELCGSLLILLGRREKSGHIR